MRNKDLLIMSYQFIGGLLLFYSSLLKDNVLTGKSILVSNTFIVAHAYSIVILIGLLIFLILLLRKSFK